MKLGERIKKARLEKGLTQIELAEIINTTKQNIYKYEMSLITNIPLDKLEKIANALDVSPAYLMGWEDEPKIESASSEDELNAYLQELRTRPEMKMLFKLTSKATKEDVEKAIKIIEALSQE